MTAAQALKALDEFLETGHPGYVLFNVATPGQPGKRGIITVVEIHQRLALTRGEPDEAILDSVRRRA